MIVTHIIQTIFLFIYRMTLFELFIDSRASVLFAPILNLHTTQTNACRAGERKTDRCRHWQKDTMQISKTWEDAHTLTQTVVDLHMILFIRPNGRFQWTWKFDRRSISIGLMLDVQTCWSDIWVCCSALLCMVYIVSSTTIWHSAKKLNDIWVSIRFVPVFLSPSIESNIKSNN